MPLADWTVPFNLTSGPFAQTTLLPINTIATFASGTGYYLLREGGCSLVGAVRETKDNIPQADGSILHNRFVQGMEMNLAIQLWQDPSNLACDELLQDMLDTLMGYLYGLLNAGDNQGRISWTPSNKTARMLDDIRLLSYPAESHESGSPMEIAVTVDTRYPYAIDLDQQLAAISDGSTVVINNTGNVPFWPVFQVNRLNGATGGGTVTDFTITNITTGFEFNWLSSNPGSQVIAGGDYGEIDCFGNTMFLNGNQANLSPGIVMLTSEFFPLRPGNNSIMVTGCDCDVLWNPAWA